MVCITVQVGNVHLCTLPWMELSPHLAQAELEGLADQWDLQVPAHAAQGRCMHYPFVLPVSLTSLNYRSNKQRHWRAFTVDVGHKCKYALTEFEVRARCATPQPSFCRLTPSKGLALCRFPCTAMQCTLPARRLAAGLVLARPAKVL